MKKEDQMIQVLAAKTSKFFKELLKFQENYQKTGRLYLENSEFFQKESATTPKLNVKSKQIHKLEQATEQKIMPSYHQLQKRVKNSDAPKKPATAFFMFYRQNRESFAKAHQEFTPNQVAQMLGKQWRESIDPEEKNKFQRLFEEEKRKYHQKLEEYEEKNGIINKRRRQKKLFQDNLDEQEDLEKQIKQIQQRVAQKIEVVDSDDNIVIPSNNNE